MSSSTSHLKNTKSSSFAVSHLFYDFDSDSEGYDLSPVNIITFAAGIVVYIAAGLLKLDGIALLCAACAAVLCCGFSVLRNLYLNLSGGRIISEALLIILACAGCIALKEYVLALLIIAVYIAVRTAENLIIRNRKNKALTYGRILPETAPDEEEELLRRKNLRLFNASIRNPGEMEQYTALFFNYFTPLMMLLTLVISIIVPIFKHNWDTVLRTGVILLLAACPFGLVPMLSLAVFIGVDRIFSAGAVIKDSRILDRLFRASSFVCNKTAVLTEKEYQVIDIKPNGISEDKLISLINAVESGSEHPIAEAVRLFSGYEADEITDSFSFTETPGRGVSACVGNNIVYAGNAFLLYEHGIESEIPTMPGIALHVAVNSTYCGYILLENKLRQGIYNPLEGMRAQGIKNLVLLSSDMRSVVRQIAGSLNFDTVKSELSPETKRSALDYLVRNRNKGSSVIFAGNMPDELQTASAANISVALDSLNCEEAGEKCDISILTETIFPMPEILSAARTAVRAAYYSMITAFVARLIAIITVSGSGALTVPVILIAAAAVYIMVICGTPKYGDGTEEAKSSRKRRKGRKKRKLNS